jgi:uncharacterized small protein (DUF1192 family)
MPERRFTEQEVADIIRRATEAQIGMAQREAPPGTLSATDVLRIGAELGVDPAALEAAMGGAVVWTSHDDAGSLFKTKRSFERRIPAPLTEADFAELMGLFEPWGIRGAQSFRVGSALHYKAMAGVSGCSVTLTGSEEGACLKVRSDSGNAWLWTLAPLILLFPGFPFLLDLLSPDPLLLDAPLATTWTYVGIAFALAAVWALAGALSLHSIRSANQRIARLMDEFAAGKAERARLRATGLRQGARPRELESHSGPNELMIDRTEGGR